MGMRYLIKPDKHTACDGQFPLELSFFFEQMSGYGAKSEVAQVAELLDMDISGFKRYNYGTPNVEEELKMWQEIDEFTDLISTYTTKLILRPEYYKAVRYNEHQREQDEQLVTLGINDSGKFLKLLEEFQTLPGYGYPSDYGYLSSGRILKDLGDLKKLLVCYKKNGVKRVKVYFM